MSDRDGEAPLRRLIVRVSPRETHHRPKSTLTEAAARRLFSEHWVTAWRTAFAIVGSRADADDIAQESLMRAWERSNGFGGRSSFKTWLTRIVVNRSIDHLRRQARRREVTYPSGLQDEDVSDASADGAVIRAAVWRLEPDRRSSVVLPYWLGLAPAEIATVLGVPLGTVHSRLSRALDDLRPMLEVFDEDST